MYYVSASKYNLRMIYQIFNQKHLQENVITIMIVKVITTEI